MYFYLFLYKYICSPNVRSIFSSFNLNLSCLSNDLICRGVLFQVVSAGERRNFIASRKTEYRIAAENGRPGKARSGCISANDSNSETEVVRGTYERRNARNSKEEYWGPGGGGKRRGAKDGAVAGCGDSGGEGKRRG